MARDDGETPWTRQLLLGVAALAAVALLIGGVVSAFALGAAKVSGIDTAHSGSQASASPSLVMPSGKPTTDVDAYPDPSSSADDTSSSPSPSASRTAEKPRPISLQATPAQVGAGQRIDLTGVYPGGEGATLQVQRLEGGAWADFPVTVPVNGGQFSTYITTSRTGKARFRVQDEASGRLSNVVRITIG
jgi:hypothetical protein